MSKKGKEKIYEPTYCIVCGKELTRNQIQSKNKTCSIQCGSICANKTKQKNGTVFVENGQGRSRSGYWKGFFCNSTYELVYYIYMSEHGYKIERNQKVYEYEWNGKKRSYYPDFRVDGKLVEIKGYWTPQVKAKIDAVKDEELNVLYYKDLEPMMEWVDSKYNTKHWKKGNNYWKLYDISKPLYRYKYICDICGKEFETNTYRKPGKWKYIICSMECRSKIKSLDPSYRKNTLQIPDNFYPIPGLNGYYINKEMKVWSNFSKGNYLKIHLHKGKYRKYIIRNKWYKPADLYKITFGE